MNKGDELKQRLKVYALDMIQLYNSLPRTGAGKVIEHQVLRSGTSVGAHHREANRGRSNAEFISKMEVGLQELDETDYWLDLLLSSNTAGGALVKRLIEETNELISIFTASVKTAKQRKKK